jgi:anti-anti-sigma factor
MSDPSPLGGLTISSSTENGAVSLALEGEGKMEESLAAVERENPARLIVDLGRLAFIDSTGLRLLLQADARAKQRGCEMVLRPGEPAVQRVFEVTGALEILSFESAPGD